MNSDSVRFTAGGMSFHRHAAQPVKKVVNFFDDDDDDEDDFETFEHDKDFAKMKVSLEANDKSELDETKAEEDLGSPWGGKAFSLKENAAKDVLKTTPAQANSKTNIQKSPSSPEQEFHPFQLRDKMTAKSTEATRVVKTSTTTIKEASRISTTTSHEGRVRAITTSSIENVVQNAQSEMTNAERNRLQAEVKELRKIVSNLRQEQRKAPQPCETVKKLMLNQPCVLEVFKSRDDKLALLDEAIKIGDGNALINVLLFIKKTVKYSIFAQEISKRPVAVRHIVSFMKSHYDYDELIKLLRHLGRKEEAMMLQYKRALSLSSPDAQLDAINSCQRTYEGSSELADVVSVLDEHQTLLKRQIHIETKDKRTQAEGKNPVMNSHPRTKLVSSPLISTLHYCCYYHYGQNDNILNPVSLQKEFKLSDKQFEWTAVGARAELKKWGDLEALFATKGLFGSNKLKSRLGFDKIVGVLEKSNAPLDILSKYLALVEIPETRLSLATSLKCHQIAVETIVSMKDRQKLEEYRKLINRTHPVQATISNYLQNSQIKWR